MELEPGEYIIVPRTSGCSLQRPKSASFENIRILNDEGKLNSLVARAINDVFRRLDRVEINNAIEA